MMKSTIKIILIDADVVSHFIVGGYVTILPHIFPYPIKILDKVYNELSIMPKRKTEIDNLINFKLFELFPFPEDNEIIKKEYFRLKKLEFRGDGESACMAVVRYSDNILASSNLKDIKRYCDMHKLKYLTTMDFLCEAFKTGKMTNVECNTFLSRTHAAGQKLPVKTIEDYVCRKINLE
ncbi:hypothetical protein [Emticicia sp. 21SJ11W-3]|uniref:hypothetical protein n=1 Tax=Emticicia sp. 21SJ11W-3 TaxID=2916755 RepID=UPI0020A12F44|nr:hypothetical protein [Emticicia sp. 21SJ11W-3]UTA66574.1 hypothetical protein MB380_13285 [Emticicia sp. 21SJ11W-3]